MRPPGSSTAVKAVPKVDVGSFKLQSILIGSTRALAVVDGTVLAPGDGHRGVKLIKINADAVVFRERGGQEFILTLTSGVKKRVAEKEKGQ